MKSLLSIIVLLTVTGFDSGVRVGPHNWSDTDDPTTPQLHNRNLQWEWDGEFLQMEAWGGECGFVLDLRPVEDEQVVVWHGRGHTEWGAWVTEVPGNPTFLYPLYSWGLDWHPQSDGSYALYHSECSNNIVRSNMTEQYLAGKAGHYYAPKAWNTKGDTVDCAMYADPSSNAFTITVPPEFAMDPDNLPYFVDPDYGYTSAGGSAYSFAGWLWGMNQAAEIYSSASSGDQVTAMSILIRNTDAGADSVKAAVYDMNGASSTPKNQVAAPIYIGLPDASESDSSWRTTTGLTQSLDADSAYGIWIGEKSSGTLYIYRDSKANGTYLDVDVHSDPWDSNTNKYGYFAWRVSMYFTVTASGGATPEAILEVHSATGAKVVHGPGTPGAQGGPL